MSTDKIENKDKAEAKIAKDELSEEQLAKAFGGIVVTKQVDVASTKLLNETSDKTSG